MNDSTIERERLVGRVRVERPPAHAAALASARGCAARAAAACSWPEMVLSRASSASICASSNATGAGQPGDAAPSAGPGRRRAPRASASRRAAPRARRAPRRCCAAAARCGRRSAGGRCRARRACSSVAQALLPASRLSASRLRGRGVGVRGQRGERGGARRGPTASVSVPMLRSTRCDEVGGAASRRRASCPTRRPSTGPGRASRRAGRGWSTAVASERSSSRILA